MKAEHTQIFTLGNGNQLKVVTIVLGFGGEVNYSHTCFTSTDGKFWSHSQSAKLTPEQSHVVDLALWYMIKPAEPMVSFL